MENTETKKQKFGFGFINRNTASSFFTTLKELVKSDYNDEDELNKDELEELRSVMNEYDKLKTKINNKNSKGNNLKKDLYVQNINKPDGLKIEVVKNRIEPEKDL